MECEVPIRLWCSLRQQDFARSRRVVSTAHISTSSIVPPSQPQPASHSEIPTSDVLLLQSLHRLWDLLGELGREIAKNTAGISFSTTRNSLISLFSSYSSLSHVLLRALVPANIALSLPLSDQIATPFINTHSQSKKKKSKGKRASATEIDWIIWASALPHSLSNPFHVANCTALPYTLPFPSSSFPPPPTLPPLTNSSLLGALKNIHSFVAPAIIGEGGEKEGVKGVVKESREGGEREVGKERGKDGGKEGEEELLVLKLIAYSFLSATLAYHHKSVAIAHTKEKGVSRKKKKGAVGVTVRGGFNLEDSNFNEYLRRTADSCNVIAKVLVGAALKLKKSGDGE